MRSERFSKEYWKEWMNIADDIEWSASKMLEAAGNAIKEMEKNGWDKVEPASGSQFVCCLCSLKATVDEMWSEAARLEKEYGSYVDEEDDE